MNLRLASALSSGMTHVLGKLGAANRTEASTGPAAGPDPLTPHSAGPVAPSGDRPPPSETPPGSHLRVTRHGGPDPYRSPKSQANKTGLAAIGHPWMGWLTREMSNSAADPYPPAAGPARAPVARGPPARPGQPGGVGGAAPGQPAGVGAESAPGDGGTGRAPQRQLDRCRPYRRVRHLACDFPIRADQRRFSQLDARPARGESRSRAASMSSMMPPARAPASATSSTTSRSLFVRSPSRGACM